MNERFDSFFFFSFLFSSHVPEVLTFNALCISKSQEDTGTVFQKLKKSYVQLVKHRTYKLTDSNNDLAIGLPIQFALLVRNRAQSPRFTIEKKKRCTLLDVSRSI